MPGQSDVGRRIAVELNRFEAQTSVTVAQTGGILSDCILLCSMLLRFLVLDRWYGAGIFLSEIKESSSTTKLWKAELGLVRTISPLYFPECSLSMKKFAQTNEIFFSTEILALKVPNCPRLPTSDALAWTNKRRSWV